MKRSSGLTKKMNLMNNIIKIHERKIPELSEKFNADAQWLKRSLMEMKEKAEFIDESIEKEKMLRIQHSTEISREIDRSHAKSDVLLSMSSSLASTEIGMDPSIMKMIPTMRLRKKC